MADAGTIGEVFFFFFFFFFFWFRVYKISKRTMMKVSIIIKEVFCFMVKKTASEVTLRQQLTGDEGKIGLQWPRSYSVN